MVLYNVNKMEERMKNEKKDNRVLYGCCSNCIVNIEF